MQAMKTPTLRQKQLATQKHFAEQFPLFKKGVTGSTIFATPTKKVPRKSQAKPNAKIGRPKTGRTQITVWLDQKAVDWLRMMQASEGYAPGVLIEMLIATMKGEDAKFHVL